MNRLLIIGALISSTSTLAHDDHKQLSNDGCQIEFRNNDVKVTPELLQIITTKQSLLSVDETGNITIDGQPIELSTNQQNAMQDYADSVRAYLPQVANIALDGLKVADVALEEISTAFELNSLEPVQTMLDELHIEISNTFYQEGAFVMGQQTFNQFGQNFEQHFEQRFETALKGAMVQSIGTILISIGSQMSNSADTPISFEQRMENMGLALAEKVEHQANNLRAQADKLCLQFSDIAHAEAELSEAIPEFSTYKLFKQTAI